MKNQFAKNVGNQGKYSEKTVAENATNETTQKVNITKTKKKSNCVVETFSRTVGFFRPVQDWNKGKVEEFKDRKKYNLGGKDGQSNEDSGDAGRVIRAGKTNA